MEIHVQFDFSSLKYLLPIGGRRANQVLCVALQDTNIESFAFHHLQILEFNIQV